MPFSNLFLGKARIFGIVGTVVAAQTIYSGIALSESDTLVVDNLTFSSPDMVTADLVGLRSMPMFMSINKADGILMSTILKSVSEFPEIKQEISKIDNKQEITFKEIEGAIIRSEYAKRFLSDKSLDYEIADYRQKIYGSETKLNHHDPLAVVNLVASGAFIQDKNKAFLLRDNIIPIADKYQYAIRNSYKRINTINLSNPIQTTKEFNIIKASIKGSPQLSKSLLFSIGKITFGMPIVMTSNEIGLSLPFYVKRDFDVYVIEFAVTFRDIDVSDINKMFFNVILPDNHIALELIPLQNGVKKEEEITVKNPDIGVNVGGTEVSVGEFYKKKVSFSYLEPTIRAFGLREKNFSWSLEGKALGLGAHKFISIVGVPKGAGEITLQFAAHFKVAPSLLAAGGITSTELHQKRIKF